MNQVIWEEIKKNSKILAYYDCPQLFTAFGYYLILAVSEDSYLVTILSESALNEFMKGNIDLRSTILLKSNAWFLVCDKKEFNCKKLESVSNEYLPETGYYMGI